MKARYEAAEASNRVSEAMTGVGDEMDDVGMAIERAEERTQDMEARAAAMDELYDEGAFDDALSDKDSIDRELEELGTSSGVEAELDTLKSDMGKGGGSADTGSADEPSSDEEVSADLEELEAEMDAAESGGSGDEAIEADLEGLEEEEGKNSDA